MYKRQQSDSCHREHGAMTALDALSHQAAHRPDDVAVVSGPSCWTYRRLFTEAERLAQGLQDRGVLSGDRVALHLTNGIELVLSYYACFRLGAIATPLNVKLTPTELEDLIGRLEPALFIGEDELRASFEPIAEAVLPLAKRVVVGLSGDRRREQPFEQLMPVRSVAAIPVPAADKPAIIIPTSGTTDKPKLAVWTPASIASGVVKMGHLGFQQGVTALIATAMVHGAALTFLLASVAHGGTAVLLRRFDADEALQLIEEHEISWTFALPAQVLDMAERQAVAPRKVTSLQTSLVAGDVSPPKLHDRFEQVFGLPLRSVLASTEIGWPFRPGEKPVSIGRVPPGVSLRIIDEAGHDATAADGGELRVREQDCLSVGYWQGQDCIDNPAEDGWFATGDLVRFDENGDLWFVGRIKDVIVRGGANIAPAEIEAVLRDHPAIAEVAVVGLPDDALGQLVAAAIVVAPGAQPPTLEDVVRFARQGLAAYKLPERLHVVPQLPRNSIGKLDRRATTALVAG